MNREHARGRPGKVQRSSDQAAAGKLRGPQQIGSAIAELLAKRGYGQIEWREQAWQAWQTAAGEQLASKCCIGQMRRGVVEVIVASSSVLQELTFLKHDLLRKIQHSLPNAKIRDLRFRVGEVDNR